jgi:hypothetical protein
MHPPWDFWPCRQCSAHPILLPRSRFSVCSSRSRVHALGCACICTPVLLTRKTDPARSRSAAAPRRLALQLPATEIQPLWAPPREGTVPALPYESDKMRSNACAPMSLTMNILVRRRDGGSYECIAGIHRLRAILAAVGKCSVTDCETHETFEVHEVDGQILVLDDGSKARAETVASQAIERARGR